MISLIQHFLENTTTFFCFKCLNYFKVYLFIYYLCVCMCEVRDSCEPPCACWELISDPPKEQQALLAAQLSPQPSFISWLRNLHCAFLTHFLSWFPWWTSRLSLSTLVAFLQTGILLAVKVAEQRALPRMPLKVWDLPGDLNAMIPSRE